MLPSFWVLLWLLFQVLWPESGWKPLPLTSLIEGSDVKKAYRKATLFIHPDKLQHKSATLQQKYIAGRVFDILQVQKHYGKFCLIWMINLSIGFLKRDINKENRKMLKFLKISEAYLIFYSFRVSLTPKP